MPWVQDELPMVFPTSLDRIRDCPDCEQGKHRNCTDEAWDTIKDEPCRCPCAVRFH